MKPYTINTDEYLLDESLREITAVPLFNDTATC